MEEKLKELGLTEEQVTKVMDLHKEDIDGKYVTKEVFDSYNEKLKKAKEDVEVRDKQIKDLQKFSKDNEELQKKIEEITNENKQAMAKYEEDLAKERLSNKIRNLINEDKEYKAHDIDLVMSQLNMANIKLEDDKVTGFKEQFDNLKTSKGFLFNKIENNEKSKDVYKGFEPADGKDSDGGKVDKGIQLARQLAQSTLASKGINVNL